MSSVSLGAVTPGTRRARLQLLIVLLAAAAAGVAIIIAPKQLVIALALVFAVCFRLLHPYLVVVAIPVLVALPSDGMWAEQLGQHRTRLVVLLAVTVVTIVLTRFRHPAREPAVVAAVGVALALMAVQVYGQPTSVGLTGRALECAVAAAIGWLAYRQVMREGRVADVIGRALVVFSLAEVCLAAAQFVTRSPLFMASVLSDTSVEEATNIGGLFRGLGTFSHANSLGLWLAFVLPFALRLVNDSSHRWRLAAAPATAGVLLGVVFTLSRGAVLVCGLVLLVHFGLRRGRLKRLAIAVGALAVAAVAIGVTPALREAVGRFTSGSADARDAGAGLARATNMEAAWAGFKAAPFTGHGFGTSAEVGTEFGGWTGLGAHNTYLDVLQGGGLLLLACFLMVGIGSLRAFRAARRAGDPIWLLAIAVLAYGMVESVIQGAFVSLIAIGLAITLALYGRQQEGSGEDPPRRTFARPERIAENGAGHVQWPVPAGARGDRPRAYR